MQLEHLNTLVDDRYPITERQFAFIQAYAEHGNGMRAVRDAGYNHSTAGSQSSAAYRLLKLERIQKAIGLVKQGV